MAQNVGERKVVDSAFHIETEGIGIIPKSKRHGRPRELFFVWFAAVLTYTGVVIGQLFTGLGLNVWESFLASFICALSFLGLGYIAASGPKAGTVTLTISRAAFGVHANKVLALFSWLSAVGWEAVTMVLTVEALLSLAQFVGLPSSGVGPTVVALIITLILTYTVPILGHATVLTVQRILSFVLAICAIIVVVAILPHVNWAFAPSVKDMAASGAFPTFLMATSIGLASTIYGWVNFAADYSRYLPEETSSGRVVWSTLLGGGIASFVIMGVGILLGTFVNPKAFEANPVNAIAHAIPVWAAVPFLLVVVIGDICANYMNAYSSGMSFLSMGIKLSRAWAVTIDGAVCTLIGLYALFVSNNFVSFFQNFLSLNITVMAPWATIYVMNFLMLRGKYQSDDLLRSDRQSIYFYSGGMEWKAAVSFVIGAVATFYTINGADWVSPLTKWFGGADLSAFAAPIVTGIVYGLLTLNRAPSLSRMATKSALR